MPQTVSRRRIPGRFLLRESNGKQARNQPRRKLFRQICQVMHGKPTFRRSICDNCPSLRSRKTLYHPCRSSGRLWR